MRNGRTLSIGHIANSRVYASVEYQPYIYGGKLWARIGKTYNGTIAGIVARIGVFVFMAHIRG